MQIASFEEEKGMTLPDWDPFDIVSNEFLLELTHFYSYMEVMSDFIKQEKRKLLDETEQTKKKIQSGEIEENQIPVEVEYESYFVGQLSLFKNTLFTSFFIALYNNFETDIVRYCNRSKNVKSQTKIIYFTHAIEALKANDYPIEAKTEELLTKARLLRNCIVHNRGEEENCSDEQKKAIKFLIRKNSHLHEENGIIIINEDFCRDILKTFELFWYSIITKSPVSK